MCRWNDVTSRCYRYLKHVCRGISRYKGVFAVLEKIRTIHFLLRKIGLMRKQKHILQLTWDAVLKMMNTVKAKPPLCQQLQIEAQFLLVSLSNEDWHNQCLTIELKNILQYSWMHLIHHGQLDALNFNCCKYHFLWWYWECNGRHSFNYWCDLWLINFCQQNIVSRATWWSSPWKIPFDNISI